MKKNVKPAIALESVSVLTHMLSTSSITESPSIDVLSPANRRGKPGCPNSFLMPAPTPGKYVGTPHATNSQSRAPSWPLLASVSLSMWRSSTAVIASFMSFSSSAVSQRSSRSPTGRCATRRTPRPSALRLAQPVDRPAHRRLGQRLGGPPFLVDAEPCLVVPAEADPRHLPRPLPARPARGLLDEPVLRRACAGATSSWPASRRAGRPARSRSAGRGSSGAR